MRSRFLNSRRLIGVHESRSQLSFTEQAIMLAGLMR
jgi:hypothetical protein